MAEVLKKYTVKLNNNDKIEQLLQENYNQACQLYRSLQDEIDKMTKVTVLKDLDIDGREKYGKIIANYISLQQKAVAQKFDIAKLMADIVKFNGDVKGALDESAKTMKSTTLDLGKLRQLAMEANSPATPTEEYTLKK